MNGGDVSSTCEKAGKPSKLPPPFVVGHTYLDRDGEYTEIAVNANKVIFERPNGTRSSGNVEMKARIHRNILSERRDGLFVAKRTISFLGNVPAGFTHSDVLPIIAFVIEQHPNSRRAYVTHQRIVAALIDDSELRPLLDQLAEGDPQRKTISWWASTMVAWFSQF